MITKIKEIVKFYKKDIILFLIIFFLSLISFALGYLTATEMKKEPIKIEEIEKEGYFINKFVLWK